MALLLGATSASADTPRAKRASSKRRPAVTKKAKPSKRVKKAPPVEEDPEEAPPMEAFGGEDDVDEEHAASGTTSNAPAQDVPAQATPTPDLAPKLTPPPPSSSPPALSTATSAPSKPLETPAATPDWVGSVAVFAVPREPDTAEAAARLQAELGFLLSSKPDVQVVNLGEVFPAPAPVSLQEGDALFAEGKSLYDNLDPEAALPKFQAAADFYTQHPAVLDPERLARVYIFMGASKLLNNDKDGAHVAFLRALSADPAAQPDLTLFGGDVQEAFSEAQAAHAKKEGGTLTIESFPPDAKVTVRGKDLGRTPLKDVALPAGHHAVVVTYPGYAPYAVYQEVSATNPATVKAELEPAPGLAPLLETARRAASEDAFDSDVMPAEVGAIADRLGARYVVLAAVERERKGRMRAELQAWDTRTQNRLRGIKLLPDSKDRDEGALAAVERVHPFLTGATKPSDSSLALPSFMKKPWFWVAVGGAALVTTGVVVYASQDRAPGLGPISGTPGLNF